MRGSLLPAAVAVAMAAASSAGCLRLTDPFYSFKPLEAGVPPAPRYSLLYGTVQMPYPRFGPPLDTVVLRQLEPGDRRAYWKVSEARIFRAFRRRALRDGSFLFLLPPGVYELERVESSSLGQTTVWLVREETRVQSRITITRPGVYDLGTLRLTAPEGLSGPFHVESLGDAGSAMRQDVLRALLRGTPWAKESP